MRLSRDDFLKAEDLATEEVDLSAIPGYHGTVLVRAMTGRERDEFEAGMAERRGGKMVQNFANTRAKVVSYCVVDDDGKRLFTLADVEAIGGKSSAALDAIFTVAARLSGLSDDDMSELTENFGETRSGSSSSPSRPGSAKPSRSSSPK